MNKYRLWSYEIPKKVKIDQANQTMHKVTILDHKENVSICKHGLGIEDYKRYEVEP